MMMKLWLFFTATTTATSHNAGEMQQKSTHAAMLRHASTTGPNSLLSLLALQGDFHNIFIYVSYLQTPTPHSHQALPTRTLQLAWRRAAYRRLIRTRNVGRDIEIFIQPPRGFLSIPVQLTSRLVSEKTF